MQPPSDKNPSFARVALTQGTIASPRGTTLRRVEAHAT